MDDKKEKKKILTLSTNFTKKIDVPSKMQDGKKSFSIEKKKPFKEKKDFQKSSFNRNASAKPSVSRKFIEQQATKAFIKKDDKTPTKSKLKLKGPINKRDFKLTVSRAMNVEEIEIKQRSLASVKRARLKDKRLNPESDEKKRI